MLAGWEQDLPAGWRQILGGTQLNWKSHALDHEVFPGEMILPGRKGIPVAVAPKGAHLLRAFDRTSPDKVRVVILGQDPYANPAWATGRAFEQGDLRSWPQAPRRVAVSLRRLVQAIVEARTGDRSYTAGDRAWSRLVEDAHQGVFRLEPPAKLFDHLERAGVLFLNTSLTISAVGRSEGVKQCNRHFELWAPLIHRVLSLLAARQSGYAIFVLLGHQAARVFRRSGARIAAEDAGTWGKRVDLVRHAHPAAIDRTGPAFFHPPNPFRAVNEMLERMGSLPISW